MEKETSDIIPLYSYFELLRKNDFLLGVEDYQLLLEALDLKFGLNLNGYNVMLEGLNKARDFEQNKKFFPKKSLLGLCKLLWLKPNQNEKLFEDLFYVSFHEDFKSISKAKPLENKPQAIEELKPPQPDVNAKEKEEITPEIKKDNLENQEVYEEETLWVRVGSGENQAMPDYNKKKSRKDNVEKSKFLFTEDYYPLDRRKIKQNLKSLPDFKSLNNSTQIDINATIAKTIERGFFKDVVWLKLKSNSSQVLFLIDNGSSMIAFGQLAKVINEELKTVLQHKNEKGNTFHSFYFYNASSEYFFTDKANTDPISFDKFLLSVNKKYLTVIIISDAGAAISGYNKEVVSSSKTLLSKIFNCTKKVAWLNPFPQSRWQNSSAMEVARYVAMFEVTENGIKNAIRFLKGSSIKTFQH